MKALRCALTLEVTLVATVTAFAQPPDSLWSRTFGVYPHERCRSVQQTSDGGYVLSGNRLLKANAEGDSVWSRVFCYVYSGECVLESTDGGYILAGWDEWVYHNMFHFGMLLKTDSIGNRLWERSYADGVFDSEAFFYSVQQTSDGSFISAGSASRFDHYDPPNFWLMKSNSAGDSIWSHLFGGSARDICRSVQQAADGGYILAGWTESFGAGEADFWLLKTDENGDSIWSRTYGGDLDDYCYSVAQTTNGYVLAGYTESFGAGENDFWLVKTDANGDSLWSRRFGGNGDDKCYSAQRTSDEGFILAGSTSSFGAGNYDFWLVRVNANGDSLWSCTFGGDADDECYSAQQTSDGGYVLGGYTKSFSGGWWSDMWLVKTGPELPVDPRQTPVPLEYALFQNYPNPFNPSTQIAYELTKAGHVSLIVYDVLGREVGTLVDEVQPIGSHAVAFDGSGLASGVYLYRFQAGDFVATKKMVLLK
jgi:hypothetical protein